MRKTKAAVAGLAIFFVSAAVQDAWSKNAPVRYRSDMRDTDLIVACEASPFKDYVAETDSGVPLTDPYASERDADKGLVTLEGHGGKRLKSYTIDHRLIRGVVTLKYDMTVLDRTDLVFERHGLILVHTYTTNAGVFTVSDVFPLPVHGPHGWDRKPLKGNGQMLMMLKVGLKFARSADPKCGLKRVF